jgi:diguanylate cyclase (GGDEF)-like protein
MMLTLVAVGRIVSAWWYRRSRHTGDFATVKLWEQIYFGGAALFSALLGAVACLAFVRTGDFTAHLVTATTAAGYAAGITGRNAGRPHIALAQVVLSVGPMAAAFLLAQDSLHVKLGLVIVLFAYALTDITLSARNIIVQALVSTRENAALVKRYAAQAALFDSALNNMSHGLCMFDHNRRLVVSNERFAELSGLPQSAIRTGIGLRELLRLSVEAGNHHGRRARRLLNELDQGLQIGPSKQALVRTSDGKTLALTRRFMADGGSVIIFEDITARRETEAHVARLAAFDELTALPNRMTMREQLGKALEATRYGEGGFALHLIDLDFFKQVNDTLGHPVGDILLKQVSIRLQGLVGEGNFVARFGGDEFVVIQLRLPTRQAADDLAKQVTEAMSLSFDVEGHRVEIGASVGIALAPSDSNDADELLKRADMALYSAKAAGRGTFRFFETAMDDAAQARRAMDLDLREAISRGELEVLFQPLVNLKTGKVSTCEALLRWHHSTKGAISPAEFIPVAEETGLIISLGDWVLQQACNEAANWPSSVRVAVNLSPVQFKDSTLPLRILNALGRSGLPPSRLELEITETTMLQDSQATLGIMSDLRRLGVRMSLDDFGTGYSSLSYLRKFPFQKIKIDGSFVKDLENDEGCIAIIRAITSMGSNLGMSIVVEGVETDAQRILVQKEGCTEVQGYLFGRPMSASAIRERLSSKRSRNVA